MMVTFENDPGGHRQDPGGAGGKMFPNDPNPGGGYRKDPGGWSSC